MSQRSSRVYPAVMSLTSLLDDSKSPLSQLLLSELPDVKAFSAAFRAVRPPDEIALRPVAPEGTRVQWGTLGAAIDHRVRQAFSDRGVPTGAVRQGMTDAVALASRTNKVGAIAETADDLTTELMRLVAQERTADRRRPILLAPDAEDRLCRVCYAMAWFEEVYRTKRLWQGTPLGDAGAGFNLEQMLAAIPSFVCLLYTSPSPRD